MRVLLLCGLLCSAAWSVTSAQTFKIGAVLPLSGDSVKVGQAAAAALKASAETLRGTGIDLEVTVLDSKSNTAYAAAQAKTLIAADIHVLLCCKTAEVAARVAPMVAAAGVPTLSLAPVTTFTQTGGATIFWLSATDTQVLTRLALAPPQTPLALLAPLGKPGDLAQDILKRVSVGAIRYPATRTLLTPEALRAATLEPGSVVIWDSGAARTVRAAAALTARGYTGTRVVRAEVWRGLDALERAELTGAVSVVSPAVLGYRLPDAHPAKERVASFRRALRGVLFETDVETLTTAAAAWDAAQLLGDAAEQLFTYAEPTGLSTAAVRGALRDALIGLGPIVGAGGSYDFSGDRVSGLLPGSLVLAVWRGGRFFPYP